MDPNSPICANGATDSLGSPATSAGAPATPAKFSLHAWLTLGLIALLYIGTCFAPVIFDDNEGLYAGAVREMHASGNWLVPTVNGFVRLQKPPLVYWTMLLSTAVLGGSEFALRLPNALATVGWIVATFLIARRLGGERLGIASALVLASMLGVWIFNHLIQPEPFLACFVSLAIWCLVEARFSAKPELTMPRQIGERFPGDRWYLLFWIFLALGSLSKGLHGALWPLGTVALAEIFTPGMRPWLRPVLSVRGIAAFLILLTPWYVYMTAKLPGFLSAHFLNEQLGASLNTRFPADTKQLPLFQFYAQHLLFWLPWTLLVPAAVYAAIKSRKTGKQSPSDPAGDAKRDVIRLLGIWFLLTQITVAFSTRQDYYSMSCWGVAAIFLAWPWTMPRGASAFPRAFLVIPCALAAFAGALALGLAAWAAPRLATFGAGTAAPIRERDTFMDAIAGISPGLWGHFLTLLIIFGAVMVAAGTAAAIAAGRGKSMSGLIVLSTAMAVPVCLATSGFSMMSPYFSCELEARAINAELAVHPDAVVACEGLPHTASSLFYYLNARVHWVDAPFDEQYPQRVLGQGRDYYWDEARLLSEWTSSRRVYFIVEQDDDGVADWRRRLPAGSRIVMQAGTRIVFCNH